MSEDFEWLRDIEFSGTVRERMGARAKIRAEVRAAHARGIAEGLERAAKIADLQAKNARTSVKCSFGEMQPVAFEQEAIGAEQIAAAIRAEAERQKEPHE